MPIKWPNKPTAEETLQQWLASFDGIELHRLNTQERGFYVTKDPTDSRNLYTCAVLRYYGGGIEHTKEKLERVAIHLDDLGIHCRGDLNDTGFPLVFVYVDGLHAAERDWRYQAELDELEREASQPMPPSEASEAAASTDEDTVSE